MQYFNFFCSYISEFSSTFYELTALIVLCQVSVMLMMMKLFVVHDHKKWLAKQDRMVSLFVWICTAHDGGAIYSLVSTDTLLIR